MKGNREPPPRPLGEISLTTGKPKPPKPPPMRAVRDSAIDGLFGFMLTVMISIAIGVMIGLKIQ